MTDGNILNFYVPKFLTCIRILNDNKNNIINKKKVRPIKSKRAVN